MAKQHLFCANLKSRHTSIVQLECIIIILKVEGSLVGAAGVELMHCRKVEEVTLTMPQGL